MKDWGNRFVVSNKSSLLEMSQPWEDLLKVGCCDSVLLSHCGQVLEIQSQMKRPGEDYLKSPSQADQTNQKE